MNYLGLFEGIGVFALAAQKAGTSIKQLVEIDPFRQQILAKNFPTAATPNCIGRILRTPWLLPDHVDVEWLWSAGHEWRAPQCYPVRRLRQLQGDFEVLKKEILERENA